MNIQSIKSFIRKLILGHDISTYYFAQAGEDAILQSIFRRKLSLKEQGFYVDIGAYHPYHHSNSYLFYINGWSGINVDPSPNTKVNFDKYRPRDINLEMGVSNKEGQLTYYMIDENSTMNSFSKQNLIENGMINKVKKEIPIPVKTLAQIFDEHQNAFNKIDFLSIDVEGLDYQVLSSNNCRERSERLYI